MDAVTLRDGLASVTTLLGNPSAPQAMPSKLYSIQSDAQPRWRRRNSMSVSSVRSDPTGGGSAPAERLPEPAAGGRRSKRRSGGFQPLKALTDAFRGQTWKSNLPGSPKSNIARAGGRAGGRAHRPVGAGKGAEVVLVPVLEHLHAQDGEDHRHQDHLRRGQPASGFTVA